MNFPSRRLFAFLVVTSAPAVAFSAPSTAVPYSPPASPVPLGSTFVNWDSLRFRETPVGLYAGVFDNPTPALVKLEVHVTRLLPGRASHSPHHHAWEEIFLVKEGQLEVSINGAKTTAGPGALVFIASNDVHNVTNVGAAPSTYFVITYSTSAVHSVPDQPAAQWAPKGTLSSSVFDCDALPGPPEGHKDVLDSPTVTCLRLESHVSTLRPGTSTTPRNRDEGDELFFVKKGVLEATVNGVTSRLGAGSLYYVAPNDERTMRNPGSEPCSYQVIKIVSERSPPRAAP
jgi:quercetin dioxygenase-like cupin family protein